MIKAWADPNSKLNAPERSEKQSKSNKKAWLNPESLFNKPEYKKKNSESKILAWSKPEIRNRIINGINAPLSKEKKRRSSIEAWKKPGYRELQLKHLKSRLKKKPSKPQIKLFKIIQYLFPNETVIFEQPIGGARRLIDVAIPKLRRGFEYDDPHWHNLEKDKLRHTEIEACGWKLEHYSSKKELENLVPLDVWLKINKEIENATYEQRKVLIEPHRGSNVKSNRTKKPKKLKRKP